jgi:hypothetical protein
MSARDYAAAEGLLQVNLSRRLIIRDNKGPSPLLVGITPTQHDT